MNRGGQAVTLKRHGTHLLGSLASDFVKIQSCSSLKKGGFSSNYKFSVTAEMANLGKKISESHNFLNFSEILLEFSFYFDITICKQLPHKSNFFFWNKTSKTNKNKRPKDPFNCTI